MARQPTKVKDPVRRQPVRAVDEKRTQEIADFTAALARACKVCEAGAALTRFSHVTFEQARFQATDGIVQIQARSVFDPRSSFALSEEKLAQALAMIDPADSITETTETIRFVRGPLSVRIKKLDAALGFWDPFKMSKDAVKADGLLEALRKCAPFVSEDATRAWSVSVLLADGYAWATNNLALVRVPLPAFFKEPIAIPRPAVQHLCSLDSIDYIEQAEPGRITISSGKLLYRFSAHASGWPALAPFFKKLPKKMPPLPPEMKEAAAVTARLSDRFVSVDQKKVEAKSTSMDAAYEVSLSKGSGLFSARLLALIASVATHAEFSFYPEPIFFKGDGIEGTATGAKPS